MYYIGYISAEASPYNRQIIENILEKSRKNNPSNGITGILLHVDGTLLQLIEGNKEQVELLFNKISCDNRHTGITKIIEGTLEKRCFPDWSMGFKNLTIKETSILSNYIDLQTCEWNTIENSFENRLNPILIFLKSFYLGDIGVASEY